MRRCVAHQANSPHARHVWPCSRVCKENENYQALTTSPLRFASAAARSLPLSRSLVWPHLWNVYPGTACQHLAASVPKQAQVLRAEARTPDNEMREWLGVVLFGEDSPRTLCDSQSSTPRLNEATFVNLCDPGEVGRSDRLRVYLLLSAGAFLNVLHHVVAGESGATAAIASARRLQPKPDVRFR